MTIVSQQLNQIKSRLNLLIETKDTRTKTQIALQAKVIMQEVHELGRLIVLEREYDKSRRVGGVSGFPEGGTS